MALDGSPRLVVRTQAADTLNLFESQRLRVLPRASERTRVGAPLALAVELDSKRWHTTAVAVDDMDGDGVDDLLVSFPQGLYGQILVAAWWRGLGRGAERRLVVRRSPGDVARPSPTAGF